MRRDVLGSKLKLIISGYGHGEVTHPSVTTRATQPEDEDKVMQGRTLGKVPVV